MEKDAIHWMDIFTKHQNTQGNGHPPALCSYLNNKTHSKMMAGGGTSWHWTTPGARPETPNLSLSPIWIDPQKEHAATKEPEEQSTLSPILTPTLPKSNKWTIFQYPTATGIKIWWFYFQLMIPKHNYLTRNHFPTVSLALYKVRWLLSPSLEIPLTTTLELYFPKALLLQRIRSRYSSPLANSINTFKN